MTSNKFLNVLFGHFSAIIQLLKCLLPAIIHSKLLKLNKNATTNEIFLKTNRFHRLFHFTIISKIHVFDILKNT